MSDSTLCNTPHPDFPDVICRINRGDHRERTHRTTTPIGIVEWPQVDTEAEFKRKDAEYFALIGRTVAHGSEIAQIIAYQAIRGPEYLFTLQYADGREVGSQRDQFYVLPTQEEIAAVLWKYRQKAFPQALDWEDVRGASHTAMLERADEILALLDGSAK